MFMFMYSKGERASARRRSRWTASLTLYGARGAVSRLATNRFAVRVLSSGSELQTHE